MFISQSISDWTPFSLPMVCGTAIDHMTSISEPRRSFETLRGVVQNFNLACRQSRYVAPCAYPALCSCDDCSTPVPFYRWPEELYLKADDPKGVEDDAAEADAREEAFHIAASLCDSSGCTCGWADCSTCGE